MYENLLRSKLVIGPVKPGFVPRDRLIERLEENLVGPDCFNRKLTLICAPPGFGKSTIVAQWMQVSGHRFGYLSLDREDAVPDRFWAYFFEAIRTACDHVRDDAITELNSRSWIEGPDDSDGFESVERFLTAILNGVLAANERAVVILDNAHHASRPQITRGMRFLLRYLPRNLHLIITTREEPDWGLNGLRASGEMEQIGPDDLRFDAHETGAFFRDVMQHPLSADAVELFQAEFGGWIAGLQLAGLCLRKDGGTRTIHGAFELVHGYLWEEMIGDLPSETRDFLISTSILSHLCGPLCDAVTGADGGERVLADLDRDNYFVSAVDDRESWYTYHPLLRKALEAQLVTRKSEVVRALHHRAAHWFDENGFREDAVRHGLEADEVEFAAEIVEREFDDLGSAARTITTRQILTTLPETVLRTRPVLFVLSTFFLATQGRYDEVTARLSNADDIVAGAPDLADRDVIEGLIATFRAMVAFFAGDRASLDRYARIADARIPRANAQWRGLVSSILGDSAFLRGDWIEATRVYQDACDLARFPHGSAYFALVAGVKLARLKLYRDGLDSAERQCAEMLELAQTHGYGSGERAAAYFGLLGQIYAERGCICDAIETCNRGMDIAERNHIPTIWCWCAAHLLRPLMIQRRFAEARDLIRRAERLMANSYATFFSSMIFGWKIQLFFMTGEIDAAEAVVHERQVQAIRGDEFFFREQEVCSLIRLTLHMKRYSEAEQMTRRFLEYVTSLGMTGFAAEIEFLLASALRDQGRLAESLALLKTALSKGRRAGYKLMFIEHPAIGRDLLSEAVAAGIEREFAAALLSDPLAQASAGDGRQDTGAQGDRSANGLDPVEPLSDRELDVLRLLTDGMTNQDIADELFVSLNTVKWHLVRIYAKLGVENRTQAAAKAWRLGVLSA